MSVHTQGFNLSSMMRIHSKPLYDENRGGKIYDGIKISSFLRKKSFQMVLIGQVVNTV